jgi:putative alpha-1,2-mannosidase
MVSSVAYSGAYPTGYGLYDMSTEAVPARLHDQPQSSGFTHFQQSGTGAIRKYYNYVRVTPMLSPLDDLVDPEATGWPLHHEAASPGYYRADLEVVPNRTVGCEVTVGPKTAVHRYTFPADADARIVIDLSCGGLAIPHGRTVPMRAALELLEPGRAQAQVLVEGVPLSVAIEIDAESWRHLLWFDGRLIEGGSRLDLESIRRTTFRPFGFLTRGTTQPDRPIEVRLGFSLRSCEQAWRNLGPHPETTWSFDAARSSTETAWGEHLDRIQVSGGSDEQRTVFATALYHSLIKPCFADGESPFWTDDGPFVFDVCTMWDIYKTQIPLLFAIRPDKAVDLLNALTQVCEQEGNYPIGYRMARGADRFFRQASALAHTALADGFDLGLPGLDWEWVLAHMHDDLLRTYGEEFLDHGVVHPITHTLDLAYGYHCTAQVARGLGDQRLAESMEARAGDWVNAFDPDTGLLRDSTFYEGGVWNYSFRLLHDMAARIELAGGDGGFVDLLDRFFGFDAEPVSQLGERFSAEELRAGYALNRFEGLNNEPDMEAPYAYHFAGRPDRTAEVVHAILTHQFGLGPGGLPGNDDSGGLSSWYVWASLGLFPVAGRNRFLVSSPAFARSVIRTGSEQLGTNSFVVSTSGFTERHRGAGPQYIQQAWLDGEPLDRPMISGRQLHAGGELHLHLGPSPSKWGHDLRPV